MPRSELLRGIFFIDRESFIKGLNRNTIQSTLKFSLSNYKIFSAIAAQASASANAWW